MVFVSRSKGGQKLKQQLVSIVKEKSKNCGFGLCPKKYKYLGNPALLEEIFTVQNSSSEKTVQVKVPKRLAPGDDPLDSMRSAKCIGCKQEYLLRVDNPICTSCRRIL